MHVPEAWERDYRRLRSKNETAGSLATLGLFVTVLAMVIVLVYTLLLGRKQQPVATFDLWQRALARRPAWFLWRHRLSLVAQVVLLLLLVAALSQPYWKTVYAARRNIVLILDVSASMAAKKENAVVTAAVKILGPTCIAVRWLASTSTWPPEAS